jgi:hypothetical protein
MIQSDSVETAAAENIKNAVIAMLQRLPDDLTYDQILDAIEVHRELESRLASLDSGSGVSHEEVERRLKKWLE